MGDFEQTHGERRLLAEMIAQAFITYQQVKDEGYIVDGEPRFIPVKDGSSLIHDDAYAIIKFFFTHSLDIAIAIGGLNIDADAIRSKLEPKLWQQMLKHNIAHHTKIQLPTKPWHGAYLIVPDYQDE